MSLLRSPFSLYGLDLIPLERTAMGIGLSGSAFPSWQEGALRLKDLGDVPLILYRRWEKIILEECRKEKYSPDIYCVSMMPEPAGNGQKRGWEQRWRP